MNSVYPRLVDRRLEDKIEDYLELPPAARAAVDAVIDLAKASFSDRSLSEVPEVFGQCIEAGERVRALVIGRLNEFFQGKPLVLRDGAAEEFQNQLAELNKVIPTRVVCPTCEEPGRLSLKVFGEGQRAAIQVLHSGDGTQKSHSGKVLHQPGTSGLQLTSGDKRTNFSR
ncbi:hypothetical protein [Planctomicrobium sp. SH527]|uniref:hypothetical protein n=1 Tax=Planctomicrobium sp. SH527 TaxID=3448123 RepID=UPI003F5BA1FD